jgi:L-methionine (R)-S-oxide reductase
MTGEQKRQRFRDLERQIDGLLATPGDSLALMANIAAAVHQALPYVSWTGFYRVVAPGLLRVGPFQGPVACVDIPFTQGVCGAAARSGETQLVEDVHAFPGHIACDASARSEIVVPLVDAAGRVFAVLDLDSHQEAAFDAIDREEMESLVRRLGPHLSAA